MTIPSENAGVRTALVAALLETNWWTRGGVTGHEWTNGELADAILAAEPRLSLANSNDGGLRHAAKAVIDTFPGLGGDYIGDEPHFIAFHDALDRLTAALTPSGDRSEPGLPPRAKYVIDFDVKALERAAMVVSARDKLAVTHAGGSVDPAWFAGEIAAEYERLTTGGHQLEPDLEPRDG